MYIEKKRLGNCIAIALLTGSFAIAPELYGLRPMLVVQAEVKMYAGVAEDYASPIESQDIAKLRAKDKAIRQAREQAGVALKSYSKMNNYTLTDDEISTITSNTYQIIGEPTYERTVQQVTDQSTVIIWKAMVNVNVDDSEVKRWLNLKTEDKNQRVNDNNALQAAVTANDQKVEKLRERAKVAKTEKEKDQLKQEFAQVDKEFLYNQKIEEADRLKIFDHKYEEALNLLKEAVELMPNRDEAYGKRGWIYYYDLKNHQEALKDVNKAIELNPMNGDWYALRGAIYCWGELNNIDKALEDYKQALQYNTRYKWETYTALAYIYEEKKDYKNAIEIYEKIIQYLSTEKDTDGFYHKQIGYNYYKIGRCYRELGDYDKAIENYNKAIEFDPQDTYAYDNRGDVQYILNRYGEAIESYNKAIEIDPTYKYAYLHRGKVQIVLDKYKEATESFRKYIELAPDEVSSIKSYEKKYNSDDYGNLINFYTMILSFAPNDAETYWKRGLSYINTKEYDKGLADFTKLMQIDSDYTAGYYLGVALINEEKKEYDAAISNYTKYLQLCPNEGSVFGRRAGVYAKKGNYDNALDDLNRAMQIGGVDLAQTYYNRGLIYGLKGEYEKAIEDFNQSTKSRYLPEDYYNRGVAYAKLGEYDRAIADMQQALDWVSKVPRQELIDYYGYDIMKEIENALTEVKEEASKNAKEKT